MGEVVNLPNQSERLSFALDANEFAFIIAGLNELPRKFSQPLVEKLQAQVKAQTGEG